MKKWRWDFVVLGVGVRGIESDGRFFEFFQEEPLPLFLGRGAAVGKVLECGPQKLPNPRPNQPVGQQAALK